ncbi:MAG: hypothetical protein CM15mP120_13160 [Pseudomonadota bacterium]|nr:MAG: hypothetical protein CM15mP120_13160 [Pseudomonadota bacterium]
MPAAKRKAADRVAATRALFIGLWAAEPLDWSGHLLFYWRCHSAIPLEDTDYEVIENADRPRQKGPIEVVEFFRMAVFIVKILIQILSLGPGRRQTFGFSSPLQVSHASRSLLDQAYLALEHADAIEGNHQRMFNAIHNAGQRFTGHEIADYLDSSDFAASDFMRAFDSASVRRKLSRAADDTRRYQISGPHLWSPWKYREHAQRHSARLGVADWLSNKSESRMATAG